MLLAACGGQDSDEQFDNLVLAEAFVSAFYAFDEDLLRSLMHENEATERIIYYQGWAQAAHYRIRIRNPCVSKAGSLSCSITVVDDFGTTLGYLATDTFTFSLHEGKIADITFSGDDPPVFDEMLNWIGHNRPEILHGPCKDYFNGGTSPGDCARAVVGAARDFKRELQSEVSEQ